MPPRQDFPSKLSDHSDQPESTSSTHIEDKSGVSKPLKMPPSARLPDQRTPSYYPAEYLERNLLSPDQRRRADYINEGVQSPDESSEQGALEVRLSELEEQVAHQERLLEDRRQRIAELEEEARQQDIDRQIQLERVQLELRVLEDLFDKSPQPVRQATAPKFSTSSEISASSIPWRTSEPMYPGPGNIIDAYAFSDGLSESLRDALDSTAKSHAADRAEDDAFWSKYFDRVHAPYGDYEASHGIGMASAGREKGEESPAEGVGESTERKTSESKTQIVESVDVC